MTQRELRNIIVKQLHTYLAGPKVVLSDQTAPEADYPLIYYQSVQQHIPGAANITTAAADGGTLTKYRREHAEATFSFTACSFNRQGKDGPISGDDEALELAGPRAGLLPVRGASAAGRPGRRGGPRGEHAEPQRLRYRRNRPALRLRRAFPL